MKSRSFRGAAAPTALVCLALAAVLSVVLAFTGRARARGNVQNTRTRAIPVDVTTMDDAARGKDSTRPLVLRDGDASILAFPPRSSTRSARSAANTANTANAANAANAASKPLTVVYLHGVHGRAENGCPWLRDGASEIGWLVCPEANAHLPNDTFSWTGTVADQRAVVARAEHAAHVQGADPTAAGVIVGFSQGAYVALDLVGARLGSYRGLVLIGADVEPSAAVLSAAGVTRIVLAAGDLDASSAPLKRAAERLRRDGVDVRFVTLGRIGHSYQTTNPETLRDAIAWAGGAA